MECSKCHTVNLRLWRPGGRNDRLLCETHLREKDIYNPDDIKYGLIGLNWTDYFPAVLIEKGIFYPPTRIPQDKYEDWKNGKNYL